MKISINIPEPISLWLDDITDAKGKEEQDKWIIERLRKVVIAYNPMWLRLNVDGKIKFADKVMVINDLKKFFLDGDADVKGNLSISGKLAEKLCNTVSLIDAYNKVMSLQQDWDTVETWLSLYVKEEVIAAKNEQDKKELDANK